MANGENKSGRPSKSGSKAFTEIFRKLIGEATQQEAAEKIGVTRQNVGRWLAGMNTPDIEALEKIADAYEVSTDYLLGRTNAKTSDIEIRAMCDYLELDENELENIKLLSSSRSFSALNGCSKLQELCISFDRLVDEAKKIKNIYTYPEQGEVGALFEVTQDYRLAKLDLFEIVEKLIEWIQDPENPRFK